MDATPSGLPILGRPQQSPMQVDAPSAEGLEWDPRMTGHIDAIMADPMAVYYGGGQGLLGAPSDSSQRQLEESIARGFQSPEGQQPQDRSGSQVVVVEHDTQYWTADEAGVQITTSRGEVTRVEALTAQQLADSDYTATRADEAELPPDLELRPPALSRVQARRMAAKRRHPPDNGNSNTSNSSVLGMVTHTFEASFLLPMRQADVPTAMAEAAAQFAS